MDFRVGFPNNISIGKRDPQITICAALTIQIRNALFRPSEILAKKKWETWP